MNKNAFKISFHATKDKYNTLHILIMVELNTNSLALNIY